jgi:Cu+-exporting ATPase
MTQQPSSCCSKNEVPLVYEYIDPVCGMTVAENSQHYFDYLGIRYLFCSAGCQQKFSSKPENYLKSDQDLKLTSSCCAKQPQQKAGSCCESESEQPIELAQTSSCCKPKPTKQN